MRKAIVVEADRGGGLPGSSGQESNWRWGRSKPLIPIDDRAIGMGMKYLVNKSRSGILIGCRVGSARGV